MQAKIVPTAFLNLVFIQMPIHADPRGHFTETYNYQSFESVGIDEVFCQDNLSNSSKDVLRGLHFQNPPYAQSKLIRVIKGRIKDVVVDIRKISPTFGKYFMCELTDNNIQLYVPEGFAHGFLSLEEDTIVSYKCSNYYHKNAEDGLMWNDLDLNIKWEIQSPLLSEKDTNYQSFKELKSPF